METFKRFETILLMERTLKITTTESTEQPRLQQHVVDQQGGNDIQMTEVKSVQQSCEGRWHQNNINSTPSALREGSMNGYDKMFEKRCSNTDSNMSSKAVPNSKKNDFGTYILFSVLYIRLSLVKSKTTCFFSSSN